jgi:hypothetical protein
MYFKDQNRNRLQSYSLLPILVAVDILQESHEPERRFDWRGMDYIMDRTAMRKLLHWLDEDEREFRDFRIEAQRVGTRTVLFTQWEPRRIELPYTNTYGAGFMEIATDPPPSCPESTGYFRIMSYVGAFPPFLQSIAL